MMLALRANFSRLQPRSSPSDVTLRAFATVPAVPDEIKKVDALVELNDRKDCKGRWKIPFFDRRRVNVTANPIAITQEISTESGFESVPATEQPHPAASNIVQINTNSQSLPFLDHPGNVSAKPKSPKTPQTKDCSLQPVSELQTDQIESRPGSKAEKPLPSDHIHDQDAFGNDRELVSTTSDDVCQIEPDYPRSPPPQTDSNQSESRADQLRPLQCMGPNCYVAFDTPVSEQIGAEFHQDLKKRLRSFLVSLKLKNTAIYLDCVAASTSPNRNDLKPTIIFLCLNSDQHKTVSAALKRRDSRNIEVVPSLRYRYAVVVQETRLCSSCISIPSSPGPLSGQIVYACLQNISSLCGVLCRLSQSSQRAQCTLGGLILVGESVYALTTSHAFLGRSHPLTDVEDSNTMEPVGNIHSYKFTETYSPSQADSEATSSVAMCDHDWALVCVPSLLYKTNTFQLPGTSIPTSIEGFWRNEELEHGSVHVLSAISGVCEGYLSPSSGYWMLESSVFEVRTILMGRELSDGDSGSWVIRRGRLCGYILSRAVGKPWGYMLCIEPVIRDICSTLSLAETVSVEIPSIAKLLEIQRAVTLSKSSPNAIDPSEGSIGSVADSNSSTISLPNWHTPLGASVTETEHPNSVTHERATNAGEVSHDNNFSLGPLAQSMNRMMLGQDLEVNLGKEGDEIKVEKETDPPPAGNEPEAATDNGDSRIHGRKLVVLTFALWLSVLSMALDSNMVATAVPTITSHFESLEDIGWYGSAYFFGAALSHPVTLQLYTFYSIKWVYIVSLLVSAAGSAISGFSPNSAIFILGRAVTGIGSTALFSGAYRIMAHFRRGRSTYTPLIAAAYGLAFIAGPILAGALTDKLSWRWCFYLQLPIEALVIIITLIVFKSPQRSADATERWYTRIKETGIGGISTFIAGITCLLLALNWGGSKYAWKDARIISLFAIFGGLLGLFIVIQIWKQDKATIPPKVLKSRTMLAATWFSFTLGSTMRIAAFYLPIWFQMVKHASALKSGSMSLPLILNIGITSIISAVTTTFVGYYAPYMICSSILCAVGCGLLSTLTPETNHAAWIGYQALTGIGIGMGVQMPFLTVQRALDNSLLPAGHSLILVGRDLGGAMFISISQSIFTNKLVSDLKQYAPLIDPASVLVNGTSGLENSIPPQYLPGVLLAYNNALTSCFTAAAAIAALTIIGSLAIEWKNIKGGKITSSEA